MAPKGPFDYIFNQTYWAREQQAAPPAPKILAETEKKPAEKLQALKAATFMKKAKKMRTKVTIHHSETLKTDGNSGYPHMSDPSINISLKLLINVKSKKVLFAEANKEFVDFLFHILSLPVGAVIKLLKKNSMVGSLGNLYDSIENLSNTYMQPNQTKDVVLNPKISNFGAQVPLLLPNDGIPIHSKFYKCGGCYNVSNVTDDPTALCPNCLNTMGTEMSYVAGNGAAKEAEDGGGFVKGVVTYMVMDDLSVKPMSTISSITMLNKFNVKDVGCLEEKIVSLEMKEGLMLLKASLQCTDVLTRVFLS